MGVGSVTGSVPRQAHRSDPHTHVAASRTIASVGAVIAGSGRSSTRTSPGAYITAPRIASSPFSVCFGDGRRGRGVLLIRHVLEPSRTVTVGGALIQGDVRHE